MLYGHWAPLTLSNFQILWGWILLTCSWIRVDLEPQARPWQLCWLNNNSPWQIRERAKYTPTSEAPTGATSRIYHILSPDNSVFLTYYWSICNTGNTDTRDICLATLVHDRVVLLVRVTVSVRGCFSSYSVSLLVCFSALLTWTFCICFAQWKLLYTLSARVCALLENVCRHSNSNEVLVSRESASVTFTLRLRAIFDNRCTAGDLKLQQTPRHTSCWYSTSDSVTQCNTECLAVSSVQQSAMEWVWCSLKQVSVETGSRW